MIGCEQVCQALNDNAQEIAALRQQVGDLTAGIKEQEQITVQWQEATAQAKSDFAAEREKAQALEARNARLAAALEHVYYEAAKHWVEINDSQPRSTDEPVTPAQLREYFVAPRRRSASANTASILIPATRAVEAIDVVSER